MYCFEHLSFNEPQLLKIWHFYTLKIYLQVNHIGQYQGPYFPTSSYIPSGPYPVPTVPLESSGICEGVLVSLALLLWLYSFYRLYSAWQRVLNFSEASIQGPQGWDLLVNWIMDRIQVWKAPPIRHQLLREFSMHLTKKPLCKNKPHLDS